jgi:hypothetical protein
MKEEFSVKEYFSLLSLAGMWGNLNFHAFRDIVPLWKLSLATKNAKQAYV